MTLSNIYYKKRYMASAILTYNVYLYYYIKSTTTFRPTKFFVSSVFVFLFLNRVLFFADFVL